MNDAATVAVNLMFMEYVSTYLRNCNNDFIAIHGMALQTQFKRILLSFIKRNVILIAT